MTMNLDTYYFFQRLRTPMLISSVVSLLILIVTTIIYKIYNNKK